MSVRLPRGATVGAATITVAVLAVGFGPPLVGSAAAQPFDARAMGMGGVAVSGSSDLITRLNPAYRAVPREGREAPRTLPVPLGLVQAALDFPELDPDSDAFNLISVVDYALNIPIALELLGGDEPSGDVDVSVGRDRLVVDLEDARGVLPAEDFHLGALQRFTDLGLTVDLGRSRGVFHVAALQAFGHNQVDFGMDDALRSVLREGQPMEGGRVYSARIDGVVEGGFSSGLTYARELPLFSARPVVAAGESDWMQAWWEADWRRPRAWAGLAYRRLFGLALAHLKGNTAFTAGSPIFADQQSFDVDYDALYTTATPDGPLDLASGQAADLGVVVRWRGIEVGAGVADVFADLTWDGARRDRFVFDEQAGAVRKQLVARDLRVVEDIPASWLVNLGVSAGAWTLAADVGASPGGSSSHAGAEWWRNQRLALRAGLELDQRDFLQAGVGVGLRGLRGSRLGLDLGLRSHSRSFSGERGLSLGLAVVLE